MCNFFRGPVLALVVAFASLAASAQTRFAIRAGVDINSINNGNIPGLLDDDNKVGFSAAIGFEHLAELGIGFEIYAKYVHRNNEFDYTGTVNERLEKLLNDKNYRRRDYIEVPINLKYRLRLPPATDFISPYITTGPAFEYRVSKDIDAIEGIDDNRFNLTYNLGGGLMFFNLLQIGINHSWYLTDAVKVAFSDKPIVLKNHGWDISATFIF